MPKSIFSAGQESLQALLRKMREDAGLTQAVLAGKLGKPQSYVSKYGSGERRLDLIELHQICKATGIPLVTFVKSFQDSLK
jgi:transcriptional regulator with XRE-family HTH domain